MTVIVLLPLLAAGMLSIFAASLPALRKIPGHEYEQLIRAPSWLVVMIGAGTLFLSLVSLGMIEHQAAQVFIGGRREAWLMIDGFSLFGSALLGAILAVTAWTPAAARIMPKNAVPNSTFILIITWFAQVMLFSQQLLITLICWLFLIVGIMIYGAVLYRPTWRWEEMEIYLVLALSSLSSGIGILWLRFLVHANDISNIWTVLLSSPPRETNGAMLLIALGLLGPAIYLPWWAWSRRGDEIMVWLPAALPMAGAGVFIFIRLLFFFFPPGGNDFSQIPGVGHLFLIKQILNWLITWGVISLLSGAVWLAYQAVRRKYRITGVFRPLVLVSSGMLLLGIASGAMGLSGGGFGQQERSIEGLIWVLLSWAGLVTVWLTGGNLLLVLQSAKESAERITLNISLWLTLAMLVAVPPLAGFRALAAFWSTWGQHSMLPEAVIFSLIVSGISAASLLYDWSSRQEAGTPHPGAGWGIIGPFIFSFLLVIVCLFSHMYSPLFAVIRQSLLQAY